MPFNYAGIEPVVQKQRFTNWCWAAATVYVCSIYKTHPGLTQAQLAASVLQLPACASGFPYPICNQTCDLSMALQKVGHLHTAPVNSPLTAQQLVNIFTTGPRPLGCQINLPGIGGHAVVISNIITDHTGRLFLKVADPFDGAMLTMPYEHFRNDYRGHKGNWIRSYYTGPANNF